MATTTMGSSNQIRRGANGTAYWSIAAIVIIGLLIFFYMRQSQAPAPNYNVEDSSSISNSSTPTQQ